MQTVTEAVRSSGGAIERGESSAAVRVMQAALEAIGYELGKVDGDFGPITLQAVRDFQKAQRSLTPDGIVGPLTAAALDAKIPKKPVASGSNEQLRWLAEARELLGTREIIGARHSAAVLHMWALIKAPFDDDETPWCAGFVGACLEEVAIKSTRSAWARSYLNWGTRLASPAEGCVVVFERGPQFGHVGFVTGRTKGGRLKVLGGNQSNAVTITDFDRARVLGYRWPTGEPPPAALGWDTLPVMAAGTVSSNEA